MSTTTDSEIKRLAKSAGLPKIMWDTVGYREKLAAFVEHARAALLDPVSGGSCDTALKTSGDVEALGWQPIETCPQDGFFLVYEDEAMRTLLRIKGIWHKCGYPAIVTPHWNDALVGDDARRMLPVGHRLEIRDGCCEEPTHWMQLPKPPSAAPDARA